MGRRTSLAAPALSHPYARHSALLNEALGRYLGFLDTTFYSAAPRPPLRDITSGTNAIAAIPPQAATAGYQAGSGWDVCTGWGTPDGFALRSLCAVSSRAADLTGIWGWHRLGGAACRLRHRLPQ
jgi:kumamolisin